MVHAWHTWRSMYGTWHLQAKRIDNMDGVMGSQHKPGQSGTHNPGVGA